MSHDQSESPEEMLAKANEIVKRTLERQRRRTLERQRREVRAPSTWSFLSTDVSLSSPIQRLESADAGNVQQIAASQLEILTAYYKAALAQSRLSFLVALVASVVGLIFFIAAVVFALKTGLTLGAIVPLTAGAIVQVVAGIVFWLYGTTTSQLSGFSKSLEMLQRYLLANSICEHIDGEERNKARAALVQEISRVCGPVRRFSADCKRRHRK